MIRRLLHPSADRMYAGSFTAFTDVLLLGLLVTLASVPVVTWFVALTAGADLLRARATTDTTVSIREYVARFRVVAASGWQLIAAPCAAAAVLCVDVFALARGLSSDVALGALAVAGLVVGVLFLRCAGTWRPGVSWNELAAESAGAARRDMAGNALLAGALLTTALIASWIPSMGVVLPGGLALAAAAVPLRHGLPDDEFRQPAPAKDLTNGK